MTRLITRTRENRNQESKGNTTLTYGFEAPFPMLHLWRFVAPTNLRLSQVDGCSCLNEALTFHLSLCQEDYEQPAFDFPTSDRIRLPRYHCYRRARNWTWGKSEEFGAHMSQMLCEVQIVRCQAFHPTMTFRNAYSLGMKGDKNRIPLT